MATLIIIVTEQAGLVNEISHTLRQEQFFVLNGNHPEHVLEMIKSMIPDMIIIDVLYGRDTLFSFSQRVHLNSHTRDTSIVALVSGEMAKKELTLYGVESAVSRDDLLKKPLQMMKMLLGDSDSLTNGR